MIAFMIGGTLDGQFRSDVSGQVFLWNVILRGARVSFSCDEPVPVALRAVRETEEYVATRVWRSPINAANDVMVWICRNPIQRERLPATDRQLLEARRQIEDMERAGTLDAAALRDRFPHISAEVVAQARRAGSSAGLRSLDSEGADYRRRIDRSARLTPLRWAAEMAPWWLPPPSPNANAWPVAERRSTLAAEERTARPALGRLVECAMKALVDAGIEADRLSTADRLVGGWRDNTVTYMYLLVDGKPAYRAWAQRGRDAQGTWGKSWAYLAPQNDMVLAVDLPDPGADESVQNDSSVQYPPF